MIESNTKSFHLDQFQLTMNKDWYPLVVESGIVTGALVERNMSRRKNGKYTGRYVVLQDPYFVRKKNGASQVTMLRVLVLDAQKTMRLELFESLDFTTRNPRKFIKYLRVID